MDHVTNLSGFLHCMKSVVRSFFAVFGPINVRKAPLMDFLFQDLSIFFPMGVLNLLLYSFTDSMIMLNEV